MSNFKNIEKLGLRVLDLGDENLFVVSAFDLESLLQSAQVVYGVDQADGVWTNGERESSDTHQARLILVEEIKRKPLRVEFEAQVFSLNGEGHFCSYNLSKDLIGKKVRVIVEEVG